MLWYLADSAGESRPASHFLKSSLIACTGSGLRHSSRVNIGRIYTPHYPTGITQWISVRVVPKRTFAPNHTSVEAPIFRRKLYESDRTVRKLSTSATDFIGLPFV